MPQSPGWYHFLESIMPGKRVAELYVALGYHVGPHDIFPSDL